MHRALAKLNTTWRTEFVLVVDVTTVLGVICFEKWDAKYIASDKNRSL